jgi:hypothetical protein
VDRWISGSLKMWWMIGRWLVGWKEDGRDEVDDGCGSKFSV